MLVCIVLSFNKFFTTIEFAGFRFASYYQDHMVLQRNPHPAVLWGYGNVSSSVTVKVDGTTYVTTVISGLLYFLLHLNRLHCKISRIVSCR